MQFLLDSAEYEEARICAQWGWVSGITTNPSILAKNGKPVEKILAKLKGIMPGPIFYQLTSESKDLMVEEARIAYDILKKRLVLKIPATTVGFQACDHLSKKYTCAITSIFSTSQAMVANAAGAKYALYYHNRAKRLLKKGEDLPAEMVNALKHSGTAVIAASLKSVQEILEARKAGVQIMTTTMAVLEQIAHHELTEQAVMEFQGNGIGLHIKSGEDR